MEKYDFIEEQLKSLIRKIRRYDYKASKYLRDNIVFDRKTGSITYTGDNKFFKEVSTKVSVKEAKTLNS